MFLSALRTLPLIISILLLSGCFSDSDDVSTKYYTWDGLEPDRWASIWLLKRYIDPQSQIELVPVGAQINNATPMAIPTASPKFKRSHGLSTFETMASAFQQNNDPVLNHIGAIINELEISPWNSSTPAVAIVEQRFRELQYQYNRVDVPTQCYAGFFDALYDTILQSGIDNLDAIQAVLSPDKVCKTSSDHLAVTEQTPVVEYPVEYVLKLINANRKVVFVDTREDEEFDEFRIPGAINLKLREVNETVTSLFKDADLVISYCVKDFRGYEVALAMSKVGVKNVGIMKPYGLKGWKDMKLPVSSPQVSDTEALVMLRLKATEGI